MRLSDRDVQALGRLAFAFFRALDAVVADNLTSRRRPDREINAHYRRAWDRMEKRYKRIAKGKKS